MFSKSNTTGEKAFEEFFTAKETLDLDKHLKLGVIKNEPIFEQEKLAIFIAKISKMRAEKQWSKEEIVELFHYMIPNFGHVETGKYLDSKM